MHRSALINSQPPSRSNTFDDYARPIGTSFQWFKKHIYSVIVFGVHKESSLKVEARSKRGQRDTEIFLRDSDNKTELFHFLADRLSVADVPYLVTVTKEEESTSLAVA